MFGNIGSTELIIVGVLIFLFFGSKKLKELARGLGESTKEVKKISKEISRKDDDDKESKKVEDL